MRLHRLIGLSLVLPSCVLLLCVSLASPLPAHSQQDAPVRRGRKYKAPPETSHIEVLVTKKFNGKPISNAAVVFNPSKNGKDEGSLEVKTDPEGKAVIDVIPTGSTVRVQVIANGFATYAEDVIVNEPTREIAVVMLRPQEQISTYENNEGKASARKPGVQEPKIPVKPAPPAATPPDPTHHSAPDYPPAASAQQ